MTRLATPNTCQIPNAFFDVLLPQLGDAELRVMLYLMRQTFGWNRDWTEKGYGRLDQICRSAGISRQGAINALKGLKERGAVESRKVGVAFEYRVRVHDVDTSTDQAQPVNVVDRPHVQSTTLTAGSQRGGPDPVNEVDREPVNDVDRIKRQSSKPTENPNEEAAADAAEDAGEAARSAAAAGPAVDGDAVDLVVAEPEPLTVAGAVGQVAFGHLDATPAKFRRALDEIVGLLERDGYDADDVLEADEHWRRTYAAKHAGRRPSSAYLTQVYQHCAEWRRLQPAGPLFDDAEPPDYEPPDLTAYALPAIDEPHALTPAAELWAAMRATIRVRMAPATFTAWFKDVRARGIDGDGVLEIEAPSQECRDRLRSRFLDVIDEEFQRAVTEARWAGGTEAVDWTIVVAGEVGAVMVDVGGERAAVPA